MFPIPLCQYRKDASLKTQSCTSQATIQKTKLAIPFYCQAKQTDILFMHLMDYKPLQACLQDCFYFYLINALKFCFCKQSISGTTAFIFHQDFYKCPKMNLSILSLIRVTPALCHHKKKLKSLYTLLLSEQFP